MDKIVIVKNGKEKEMTKSAFENNLPAGHGWKIKGEEPKELKEEPKGVKKGVSIDSINESKK